MIINNTNMEFDFKYINEIIESLSKENIFGLHQEHLTTKEVWQRVLRLNTSKIINFESFVCKDTVLSYKSLFCNRLLTYLYERSFIFLPENKTELNKTSDFYKFYSLENEHKCSYLKIFLEKYCLSFLNNEIKVSETWNKSQFLEYYKNRVTETKEEDFSLFSFIENSKNPITNIKILTIQQALDFLPEASHMARMILGDYGKLQSKLFKILIDEYGYGIHDKKHSTLFKQLLSSLQMETNSHAYWQYYQSSTLLLNNLFHYLTQNKIHFFKYLGAIALAEHSFIEYCKRNEYLIKKFFPKAKTEYYSEHNHIDSYHSSMSLELIESSIDKYGKDIISEIITGIEWVLYVQSINELDIKEQILWQENSQNYKNIGTKIIKRVRADNNIKKIDITEPKGELSTLHVHDGDEFCVINKGTMSFINGFDKITTLNEGDATIIKKNRLHGALIESENCEYSSYSIGDYKKYITQNEVGKVEFEKS